MNENGTKLKIVEGGYYRARNGDIFGPVACLDDDDTPWQARNRTNGKNCLFLRDGRRMIEAEEPETDLIAPWEEPISLEPGAVNRAGPHKIINDEGSIAPAKPVYRVGDEVELGGWFKIVDSDFNDGSCSIALDETGDRWVISPKLIIRHIPAHREIEVGCRVRNKDGNRTGQVLALHDRWAWVAVTDRDIVTWAIENLTRID